MKNSTIDWTFNGTWQYEPKWFESQDGKMHYIDEGSPTGRPVILVHGNPTWGYLYRHFIQPLTKAGYRVIVPDHLGFGRSEKPDQTNLYAVPRHAERFEALIESLNLQNAVLVAHDWGGPISLWWAVRHSHKVAGMFLLNTGAYVVRQKEKIPLILRLFRTKYIGEMLVKGLELFKKGMLFKAGIIKHERMNDQIKQAYLALHPTWASRTPVLAFPRQIPIEPQNPLTGYFEYLESQLIALYRNKPVEIMWGMQDIAWSSDVLNKEWKRILPDAQITPCARCRAFYSRRCL
ncbi:alpha/beta fold hydrolase [Haemophilus paracuniculus]|nr:alpha/beta fold hydrolase [Haemophilus paracuniculus]